MIRKNMLKAIAMGMCLSVMSNGSAFAMDIEKEYQEPVVLHENEENPLLQMQREIDEFVFVNYAKDIANMGVEVTYTGVADEFVEIGITPWNDEFEDFLYETFDQEFVKVVEGEAVMLYNQNNIEPNEVSNTKESLLAQEEDPILMLSIGSGIVLMIGGYVLFTTKRKKKENKA